MCMQWATVSAESGAGSSVTGGVGSIRQARLDEADQDSDSEGSVDSLDSEDSDGEQNTNFSCSGKNYKVRGKHVTFTAFSARLNAIALQRKQMRSQILLWVKDTQICLRVNSMFLLSSGPRMLIYTNFIMSFQSAETKWLPHEKGPFWLAGLGYQ